jgi:hypothetical protein
VIAALGDFRVHIVLQFQHAVADLVVVSYETQVKSDARIDRGQVQRVRIVEE